MTAASGEPVVRLWRAEAGPQGPDAYLDHFSKEVEPLLRAIPAFIGVAVLCRALEGGTEVLVASTWQSLDAVKRFAGEDHERAVIHPDALRMLRSADERVRHYRVAQWVTPTA